MPRLFALVLMMLFGLHVGATNQGERNFNPALENAEAEQAIGRLSRLSCVSVSEVKSEIRQLLPSNIVEDVNSKASEVSNKSDGRPGDQVTTYLRHESFETESESVYFYERLINIIKKECGLFGYPIKKSSISDVGAHYVDQGILVSELIAEAILVDSLVRGYPDLKDKIWTGLVDQSFEFRAPDTVTAADDICLGKIDYRWPQIVAWVDSSGTERISHIGFCREHGTPIAFQAGRDEWRDLNRHEMWSLYLRAFDEE